MMQRFLWGIWVTLVRHMGSWSPCSFSVRWRRWEQRTGNTVHSKGTRRARKTPLHERHPWWYCPKSFARASPLCSRVWITFNRRQAARTSWSVALHKLVRSYSPLRTQVESPQTVRGNTPTRRRSCRPTYWRTSPFLSYRWDERETPPTDWEGGMGACQSVVSNLTGCQAYKWANMLTEVNRSTKIFAELWQQWKLTGSSKAWITLVVALEAPVLTEHKTTKL